MSSKKQTVIPINNLEAILSRIQVIPVENGAVAGPAVNAGTLWSDQITLLYVIRRPGCIYCREQAQGLITLLEKENLLDKVNLIGIIKQVAPVPRAPTDYELGVEDFRKNYFGNRPIFLDANLLFFKQLGNRKIYNQPWGTWNPITMINNYFQMTDRIKKKQIKGNLIGEGTIQGGVIIVQPVKGVQYIYHEETGSEVPSESICAAINKILYGFQPMNVVPEDTVESLT